MENISMYVLDEQSRQKLIAKFPPKYPNFIGHHVTVDIGKDISLPKQAVLKVTGYVDSGDGLEVLVVTVDGTTRRQDGGMYHITWSLDPTKYKPKNSNDLVKSKEYTLIRSIPITTTPEVK